MTEHDTQHHGEHDHTGIGAHHDWHSPDYVSDWISADITKDAERRPLLRWAASLLAVNGPPARVLDVGGGYGEFAGQVLAEHPSTRVWVQDYSAAMLDRARANLARYGDRASYRRSDLTDPEWARDLDGPFDAVVSALAIHNLGGGGTIRPVYAAVYSLLRPGGWFFNLDLVLDVLLAPPETPLSALYARAAPPTRDHHHDGPEATEVGVAPSLQDHLGWLGEAGFDQVDCVRKHLAEVFLAAQRPPNRTARRG